MKMFLIVEYSVYGSNSKNSTYTYFTQRILKLILHGKFLINDREKLFTSEQSF